MLYADFWSISVIYAFFCMSPYFDFASHIKQARFAQDPAKFKPESCMKEFKNICTKFRLLRHDFVSFAPVVGYFCFYLCVICASVVGYFCFNSLILPFSSFCIITIA